MLRRVEARQARNSVRVRTNGDDERGLSSPYRYNATIIHMGEEYYMTATVNITTVRKEII